MRKVSLILAVFLFAAPAWATVDVTCDVNTVTGVVTVSYDMSGSEPNKVRAFALDISVSDGVITSVGGYHVGESNEASKGYGIFPSSFATYIDATDPCWEDPNYTPLADPNEDDTKPGLNTNGITVEMGALYSPTDDNSPNRPPLEGVLLTFTMSEPTACVTIAMNSARGGVILTDSTSLSVGDFNSPGCCGLEAPLPPASITYPNCGGCSGSYTVSWAASEGATYYEVDVNNGSDWVLDYSGANTSYGESVGDGSYRYRVRACNAGGCSDPCTGDHVCIVATTAPPAPASLTVPDNDADGVYNVSWAESAGAAYYELQSKTDYTPSLPVGWVQVYSGPNDTSGYTERVGGGKWSYQVRACNAGCCCSEWTVVNSCTVAECLIGGNADGTLPGSELAAWRTWRYSRCWCWPRQCRGDINGLLTGPYWVQALDLTAFRAAYGKNDAALVNIPKGVCADLNHIKTGPSRVQALDLTIFRTYYGKGTANVPICTSAPVITGPYNYWTTPP